MKTENKALIIKGIVIPDYKEPKGAAYYNLMAQKKREVAHIYAKSSKAVSDIDSIEKEIEVLKSKLATKENGTDKYQLKKDIRELKKLIKPLEPVAYADIKKDIDIILNDPEIERLKDKATKEFNKLHKQVDVYNKELDKSYLTTKKDINRFMADYGSDSYYREAAAIHNGLKN